MKISIITTAFCVLLPMAWADPEADKAKEEQLAIHKEGSDRIADEQDELSADVQQLVIEQTVPKVIELLGEVEEIMDETTDRLVESDTGGETIAAQTEIIEKIHAAAKEKQSGGGQGKSGSAMMDMMERMMGKKPEGEPKSGGKGDKPSDEGSNGQTGDSDTGNEAVGGASNNEAEMRRVPKASGSANLEIPGEFRKAFDAYNRGAEQKVK